MLLLDRILLEAQKRGAHDLHLIGSSSGSCFTVLYRNQRVLIDRESFDIQYWNETVELLKFHSGYRIDRRMHFQDGAFTQQNCSLRIAFTPYPTEYIVIRLHYLSQSLILPFCSVKSHFLHTWSQDFKVLLIAGGLHSGKTTMYYDILNHQAQQHCSILSLEDPIEKPMSSFFQLKYHGDQSAQAASSLVRFDTDLVGLGELRRESDWRFLHFLALSSIRTLSTCHGSSLETLRVKIKGAQLYCDDLSQLIFGIIFLQGADHPPVYYHYDDFIHC